MIGIELDKLKNRVRDGGDAEHHTYVPGVRWRENDRVWTVKEGKAYAAGSYGIKAARGLAEEAAVCVKALWVYNADDFGRLIASVAAHLPKPLTVEPLIALAATVTQLPEKEREDALDLWFDVARWVLKEPVPFNAFVRDSVRNTGETSSSSWPARSAAFMRASVAGELVKPRNDSLLETTIASRANALRAFVQRESEKRSNSASKPLSAPFDSLFRELWRGHAAPTGESPMRQTAPSAEPSERRMLPIEGLLNPS